MFSRVSRLRRATAAAFAALIALTAGVPAATATSVYTGDKIKVVFSDDHVYYCTLNSVARRDGVLYGTTAGHCMAPRHNGAKVVRIHGADGSVIASNMKDSGYALEGRNGFSMGAEGPKPNVIRDYGWFRLDPGVRDTGTTRGGSISIGYRDVDHRLTEAARIITPPMAIGGRLPISAVHPGQILCKDGGTTGRTCGPVVSTNPQTGEILALILSLPGDSGSPVWMTGRDGRAYIVGVHAGTFRPFRVSDSALPLPDGLS